MAIDFSKFDQQVDTNALKADIKEAEKNGGGAYKEVPAGTYVGKFDKLEIGATKDGRPMLKAQFRIMEGEYKNSCVFMNRVLFGTTNDANMIASAVGFLNTLEACDEDGELITVEFNSYSQFNDLVMDIMESIDADQLGYEIEYNPNAFNNISIETVIEL